MIGSIEEIISFERECFAQDIIIALGLNRLYRLTLIIDKVDTILTVHRFQRIGICQPGRSDVLHRIGINLTETVFEIGSLHLFRYRPVDNSAPMIIHIFGRFGPVQVRMTVEIASHNDRNAISLGYHRFQDI